MGRDHRPPSVLFRDADCRTDKGKKGDVGDEELSSHIISGECERWLGWGGGERKEEEELRIEVRLRFASSEGRSQWRGLFAITWDVSSNRSRHTVSASRLFDEIISVGTCEFGRPKEVTLCSIVLTQLRHGGGQSG